VGPCVSNDREVNKEAGVEGGGQWKCVAKVTCTCGVAVGWFFLAMAFWCMGAFLMAVGKPKRYFHYLRRGDGLSRAIVFIVGTRLSWLAW
jgi:hypothetical protein